MTIHKMKISILLTTISILLTYQARAVSDEIILKKDIPIKNGDSIEIERFPGNVYINISNSPSASVSAAMSVLPFINIFSNGSLIKISLSGNISTRIPINVKLNIKNISSISIKGACDAYAFNIKEKIIKVKLYDSSSFSADGDIGDIHADVYGSGTLNLRKLLAKRCFVNVNGAGEATVHASDFLYAKVSGASDLICYGHPNKVFKEIYGVGDVKIIE